MNKYQFSVCLHSLCVNNGTTPEKLYHLLDNKKTFQQNLKRIQKHLGIKGSLKEAINPTRWNKIEVGSILKSRKVYKPAPAIRKRLLEDGIKPIKASGLKWENAILVGADTETARNDEKEYPGLSIITTLLQLYHPSIGNVHQRYPKQGRAFFDMIIHEYPELFQEKKTTIFFFHNLSFDITNLLGTELSEHLVSDRSIFKKIVLSLQSFIYMKYKGYNIMFIDTGNFFPDKLSEICEDFKLPATKMASPPCLGHVPKNEKEWKELIAYGDKDAEAVWYIAEMIKEAQQEVNVGICPTVAESARKNLQTNYMQKSLAIPEREMCDYLWKCKHGAVVIAYRRGYDFKNLYDSYDVNSLYSYIMMNTPLPFSIGYTTEYKWLTEKQLYDPNWSGCATVNFSFPKNCNKPCLPVKGDKLVYPLRGESSCTLEEIRYAKSIGCRIRFVKGVGWHMNPELDIDNPLKEFATVNAKKKDHFSEIMKNLSNDMSSPAFRQAKSFRFAAQQANNTIYGKTGQVTNGIAGSCYHPMIAPIILGAGRLHMFKLIHTLEKMKIEVVYIDTDCLWVKADTVPIDWVSDTETGKLKKETDDPFYPFIVRSKMYMGFDEDGVTVKKGYHGIKLSNAFNLEDLREALLKGSGYEIKYMKQHWNKPKESLKRGMIANKIVYNTQTINLGEDQKRVYRKACMKVSMLRTMWIASDPIERV